MTKAIWTHTHEQATHTQHKIEVISPYNDFNCNAFWTMIIVNSLVFQLKFLCEENETSATMKPNSTYSPTESIDFLNNIFLKWFF